MRLTLALGFVWAACAVYGLATESLDALYVGDVFAALSIASIFFWR